MLYVRDVLSGVIPACKWVRLACQRHLDDLEHGAERGLYFDEEAAQHAIDFFGFVKHSKGRKWAGKIFKPSPWQDFITWNLFGWKREDGWRRFRIVYICVARKNGKTTYVVVIGLYLFMADGEPGAEVYAAATKRDQARIAHSEAIRMVKTSPALRRRIRIYRDNLNIEDTASKFEPLGADADTMDGLNLHGGLVDELHAHKTPDTWESLDTATGSRDQPMLIALTTAGFNPNTICGTMQAYCEQILEGVIKDDTHFAYIATLDKKPKVEFSNGAEESGAGTTVEGLADDWKDERVWIKPNPNLGVSVNIEDLRRKAKKAERIPSELNAFLRRHMNVWTQQETRWIPMEAWYENAGQVPLGELQGRFCTAGLDLASTVDLAAWCICWPPTMEDPDGPYYFLWRFWIPRENIRQRVRKDKVPYDAWVREGYIKATVGNCIDHATIRKDILADSERFKLKEFAFDRFGASEIVTYLQNEGLTAIPFGQGTVSMNPPMRQLEGLLMARRAIHGGNPVATWNASNVVATEDSAGNLRPDRKKSIEKIDGTVAQLMSLGRAIRHKTKRSPYRKRGIRIIG